MIVVSFFTPAPSKEQIEAITFTGDYKKQIRDSWSVWDIVAILVLLHFVLHSIATSGKS
jgi:SSS family solute:Na+ symporter